MSASGHFDQSDHQYPAEKQSQRADLLRPASLPSPQSGRTVLQ